MTKCGRAGTRAALFSLSCLEASYRVFAFFLMLLVLPMIFRVTFGFAGAGVGWSETHAMLAAATDPTLLVPTVSDIASKRAQMLGTEFSVVAIRIARYSDNAGARARGVKLVKQTWVNTSTQLNMNAEPAQVALMVRGDSLASPVNPQFDANENQTFLGGPIDICVDNAGKVFQNKGGLGAAFASWRSAMITAGMGWLASQTILDVPITTITQNANGTVQFASANALLPTLTQGQTYKARIRRVNGGNSPLNGEILLTCDDNEFLTSYEIIGIALTQTGGRIRFYKQVAPFVQYGDLILSDFAGNHKRGRPFGSKPGRARKRVRG